MVIAGEQAWDSKVICDPIRDRQRRSRYSMVRRRRRGASRSEPPWPNWFGDIWTDRDRGHRQHANRNHLLSHLRRQRHRRHGARPGAGRARPRNPFHHLRQSHPAGPGHAAHLLSRSGSIELSALPISAVLPGAGIAHGGSGRRLRSRSAARALRDSAFHRGHAGPADGGRPAPPALHHHAAWHRYHHCRHGPVLFPNHQVLDRKVGRDHQRQPGRAARYL